MKADNALSEIWAGLGRQERIILAVAMLFLLGIGVLIAFSLDGGHSGSGSKAVRAERPSPAKAATVVAVQTQANSQQAKQPEEGKEQPGASGTAADMGAGDHGADQEKRLDASSAVDTAGADVGAAYGVVDRESWLASDPALQAMQRQSGKSHESLLHESDDYAALVWASLGRRRALMDRLYKPRLPVSSDLALGAALQQLGGRVEPEGETAAVQAESGALPARESREMQARITSLRQLADVPPAMDKPPSEAEQDIGWLEDYVNWLGPAWQGMKPHLNAAALRDAQEGLARIADIDAALGAVLKAVGDLLAAIAEHRLEAASGDAAILARVQQEMGETYDMVVHPFYLETVAAKAKVLAQRPPASSQR